MGVFEYKAVVCQSSPSYLLLKPTLTVRGSTVSSHTRRRSSAGSRGKRWNVAMPERGIRKVVLRGYLGVYTDSSANYT